MTSSTARANALRKPPRPVVAIATPVHSGVHPAYVGSLLATHGKAYELGVSLRWVQTHGDSLVPRARNVLAAIFLADPAVTHIFWIDGDISWNPDDVFRLLAHDVDFVCGLYVLKTTKFSHPVERFVFGPLDAADTIIDEDRGLFEIDCAGTGFMMTKRVVYERMMAAYPDSRISRAPEMSYGFPKAMPYLHNFFPVEVVDGVLVPEDYGFCHRWRAIGGKVWADPTVQLTHHGAYAYTANPMSMLEAASSPAAFQEIAA